MHEAIYRILPSCITHLRAPTESLEMPSKPNLAAQRFRLQWPNAQKRPPESRTSSGAHARRRIARHALACPLIAGPNLDAPPHYAPSPGGRHLKKESERGERAAGAARAGRVLPGKQWGQPANQALWRRYCRGAPTESCDIGSCAPPSARSPSSSGPALGGTPRGIGAHGHVQSAGQILICRLYLARGLERDAASPRARGASAAMRARAACLRSLCPPLSGRCGY